MQGIEVVINTVLKDNVLKNALNFVTYLRTDEMLIEGSESYWEVKYKDKCVCFIWVN